MVMHGDQVDKTTEAFHLSRVSEQHMRGVPIVGPIWRGRIEIAGSLSDKLDGLEIFMPKASYSKAVKVIRSMQPSIYFSMQSRHALWPKQFDEVGAARNDIGLFMFPEMSSETYYDNLVELMIANDLAMTSRIDNLELIIFTSLEQEDNQQQIQGKYYLWGIFKGKGLRRCKPSKVEKLDTPKRALDCAKKSKLRTQIPFSGRIALSAEHQLITTTPSLANCGCIPPLSQECKRARSKRRKITTMANEEANVCQAAVEPGKEKTDRQSNGCVTAKCRPTHDRVIQDNICSINEQIQQAKCASVDKVCGMKDDPTTDAKGGCSADDRLTNQDSPLLDCTEKVTTKDENEDAEQHSWDSNMEIDEPSGSFGIHFHAEKTNVSENPGWDCNTKIDEPRDDVAKGLYQGAAKVHQPECQTSGLRSEKDPCTTPLLNCEGPGPSSSSTDTVVLELDEDEQTTMKESRISDDESDMITTSSMLRISDDVHESCSGTLRVQVGRYTIRSDLAPILTKILNKHGDIALGCSVMPEVLLEDICKAVHDIEQLSFSGLRSHHLDRLSNLCQLCEALKINMKWLSKRCDDLEKTALQISQYLSLNEQMAQYTKTIQSLEQKVQVNKDIVASLLHENQSLEEKRVSLKERQENMRFEVESIRSESKRFLGKSVMDGLF